MRLALVLDKKKRNGPTQSQTCILTRDLVRPAARCHDAHRQEVSGSRSGIQVVSTQKWHEELNGTASLEVVGFRKKDVKEEEIFTGHLPIGRSYV